MRGANRAPPGRTPATPETSPHAWSKRLLRPDPRQVPGNISTCVEQTQRKSSALRDFRNISTCVEQTLQKPNDDPQIEKHLHMRGANLFCPGIFGPCVETSPHAWSKLPPRVVGVLRVGNISTCVEQTKEDPDHVCWTTKHLHMRGANLTASPEKNRCLETSPHAWSKLLTRRIKRTRDRNISTCVEQTQDFPFCRVPLRKHLHMRGANSGGVTVNITPEETSPHAWSKHYLDPNLMSNGRNISTCVEQTAYSVPLCGQV